MRVEELYPPFPFISTPDFHSVKVEWYECLEELADEGMNCSMEVTIRKKEADRWDQIYLYVVRHVSLVKHIVVEQPRRASTRTLNRIPPTKSD